MLGYAQRYKVVAVRGILYSVRFYTEDEDESSNDRLQMIFRQEWIQSYHDIRTAEKGQEKYCTLQYGMYTFRQFVDIH